MLNTTPIDLAHGSNTIIHAAYEGCGAVSIGDRLFSYPNRRMGDGYGGVLPETARKLIREGVDPKTLVRITRGGTNTTSG